MRGNAAEAGKSAQERSAGDIGAVPRESVVARLRAQIERVQAAPRRLLAQLSTGAPALDGLGVFQLGGAVELSGEEASGRTTVALSLVAAASREKRLAAWVDGPQELYPPAAVPLGVELQRLLIVRPPGPGQLVWSAVQLLRSGAFTCVVLDVTHTGLRLSMVDTRKLLDAARAGGALLVVLTSSAAPAQGLVRLVLASRVEGHESRLRVVGAEAGDEPMVHVEVARAQQRTGRTLVVPRAVLGPQARSRRSARVLVPGLTVPSVSAVSSLERPKAYEQRDGRGLYVVTRPGREGRLTPLGDASRPQGAPAGPRRRPAAKLAGLEAVRTGPAAAATRVQARSFR
ncbi:MAG: recombinase RecA [Myxococcaceae bacterium]|nr:recombinase RecA [Myxococcaceae bacterium]